ncbi:MAG: PIN domain-containing protein [Anaerolineae bacterium]|nr:PIN domain-containing protein [Anaerolineae bacterium]
MSEPTPYVFDTNIVSALVGKPNVPLLERIRQNQSDVMVLCEPVIYEIEKGLEHKKAAKQLAEFQSSIIPLFNVVAVQLTDWRVAAKLWAFTRSTGKQLSDIDLLLAATVWRLKGILVSNDADFDAIPNIMRENWLDKS